MRAKTIVQYNHQTYIVTSVEPVIEDVSKETRELLSKAGRPLPPPKLIGDMTLRLWPFKAERSAVEWIVPTIIRRKKSDIVVRKHDLDRILLEW